jgi:hypothetical protein
VARRWPERGVLAMCASKAGHCGFGRVLAGLGRGNGALWVGAGKVTTVGNVQRAEGEERGSWAGSPSSPPFLTARVRAEGAGLDRGDVHGHGYRARANWNSVAHSSFDFLDFCPPRVRSNARKNSNFKFLKTATVVRQHIGQGFQRYFCPEELSCFAKICI